MPSTKNQILHDRLFALQQRFSDIKYRKESWKDGRLMFTARKRGYFFIRRELTKKEFTSPLDLLTLQELTRKKTQIKFETKIKDIIKEEKLPKVKRVTGRQLVTFGKANIFIVIFSKSGKTMQIIYTLPGSENKLTQEFNGQIIENFEYPYNEFVRKIKMDVLDKTNQTLESHLLESKTSFRKKVFGGWRYRVIEREKRIRKKFKDIIRKERNVDLQNI